jgi:hypothetical protein
MAHARLAQLALITGDPRAALKEIGLERRAPNAAPGLDALAAEARDSLAARETRDGR